MNIKNVIITGIISFIVWILLNNSLHTDIIISGIIVSLIIAVLFGSNNSFFAELKITPTSFINIFLLILVFIKELIKANIDVAKRVISPSLPINPGIVKVKTKLKSRTGRLLLANLITLTPGTLSLDIEDEFLYIHWINVTSDDIDLATKEIVTNFEKRLEVIYG